MASTFVNIDDVSINLIDSVNPFQRASEVMSKSVTPSVLRIISDAITATRVQISEEEALALFPRSRTGQRSTAAARTYAPRTPPKAVRRSPAVAAERLSSSGWLRNRQPRMQQTDG